MTSTKQQSSPLPPTKSEALRQGAHDAIPVGLGYFAVAFSLGIICRSSGLTVFQGFLASLLNNT